MKRCPRDCPCLCHEFGITAEHGEHKVCPTKIGQPLVDPQWASSYEPTEADRECGIGHSND